MKSSAFLFLILFFCACSRQFVYLPQAEQANAQITYNDGIPVLFSDLGNANAYIDLRSIGQSNLNLRLSIQNNSDSMMTFLPEMVRATGYNAAGQPVPLRVFSAEEFIRRRNTRNAILIGATVVTAVAIAASAASDSHSHKDEDCNNHYDSWYYAPPLVVVNNNGVPSNHFTPRNGLLRRHTVFPGEVLQGVIKIRGKASYMNRIKIEIPNSKGEYLAYEFDQRMKLR